MINHLKHRCVNELKDIYENFGEEEKVRKEDYIKKLTPILLNTIYDRRH